MSRIRAPSCLLGTGLAKLRADGADVLRDSSLQHRRDFLAGLCQERFEASRACPGHSHSPQNARANQLEQNALLEITEDFAAVRDELAFVNFLEDTKMADLSDVVSVPSALRSAFLPVVTRTGCQLTPDFSL